MAELRFPNINFVILSGRLVEDAVVRYTPQGTAVCTVRFASDRNFKNSSGQWVKEPMFINLVFFGDVAVRSQGKLKKGSPLIVEGSLRSRTFENREGQRRTVYEILVKRLHILEKVGEEVVYSSEEDTIDVDAVVPPEEGETFLDHGEQQEEELPF